MRQAQQPGTQINFTINGVPQQMASLQQQAHYQQLAQQMTQFASMMGNFGPNNISLQVNGQNINPAGGTFFSSGNG